MIDFISDLFAFSRQPSMLSDQRPLRSKANQIFYALSTYFILGLGTMMLINIVNFTAQKFCSITIPTIKDYNFRRIFGGTNPILIFSLLGPLIEETMFRLWLSMKKIHIIIAIFAISFRIVTMITGNNFYLLRFNMQLAKILSLSAIPVLAAIILSFFLKKTKTEKQRYFPLFFWVSCFLFSAAHLTNYPLKLSLIWAYPFLILPQFILGYILAYIRVKNGFLSAVIIHSLANLPSALMVFNFAKAFL